MKQSKTELGIIIFLFIIGIISFWLGLESVRTPNILGEHHPPQILFIGIMVFSFTFGGVFLGKHLSKKNK